MPAAKKFSPRELMEQAIDVMRHSVNEPREDGKASPLVGAVLVKPDGTIETACRGELRYGDHAEYTLLERKNRNANLDGSILFATLEPCAPGARAHQKLSCAERIVLARIKEVWVGIEDPDPTVDRKGIKYLQDHGVNVHMFDRHFQEIILEENERFIAQALERAAEAEEEEEDVILSELEAPVAGSLYDEFSREALLQYIARSGVQHSVNSSVFRKQLARQGILQESNGKVTPTGFGMLLFGKEPREVMHQAGLLGTINYPDGSEETVNFEQPLVLIPDLVEEWLRNKLPNVISRDQMQRKEMPVLPFEMIREAVVNALVHRDYNIEGAKCQLVVDEHTVVIMSPGLPPSPITMEQLQSFNAPMLSRNPGLHYVFAKMELAEERGLGIKSLKSQATLASLPLPKYMFNDPYLVLTLYRSPESASLTLAPQILAKLSEDERMAWQFIVAKDSVTTRELMEEMGFPERKSQRVLSDLIDAKLVRRVGAGRATHYEVVQR